MSKKNVKRVALLTIQSPGKMTVKGRRDVARWLRETAAKLVKEGHRYTDSRSRHSFNYFY